MTWANYCPIICAIFYWLVGYSLAYTDGNPFFGYSGWAGASVSSYSFWVFEFVFASTASTILSGAVAERCSFVTYMAYSSIISGFVYPVASHWAWGEGGWLKTLNFLDFAGCGVVHSLGGVCAFIAAVFLGPRIGRFKDGKVVDKPGHSMSMVGLGGLLLISGFMGFNAGALGHINGRGKALGKIVQNTVLGGSGAAVTVLVLCRLGLVGEKKWAFAITLNGVIAGIVAVCGAVDQYSPFMALVVGAGGCLAFLLVRHIVLKLQVDDPLDAVGVHFGGGFFGLIAGPMFIPNGVIFGLNDASLKQLVVNLAGGGAIVLWSACCSVVLFGSLWISGQLRVSEEQEIRGWAGASVSSYSFWVFEFVFASTASTILSGAVAERCSFVTYMAYSSIISGFVYPVASHWAWGEGGWLKTLNFLDFAGCGVVHSLGGVCAFIAAVFLGPRIGRFKDGKVVDKPGHSMSMVGLGGLLLISGFMGFNAGALGHINGRGKALGKIVQNTVLGGSGAAVTVLVLCRLGLVGEKKWAFAITLNGVIAGIVAVCGAVDQYSPFMALVVGAGGCLAFLLVRHIVLKLQVDDPLDAVGVHFGGGFFGLIAGPMFIPNGVIFGLNDASLKQLVVNLAGGGAIVLWSACCSVVLFGSLWISGQLRVSEEQEIRGLDATKHNEPAYPIEGWAIDYPIQISQNSLHKSGSYTLNRSSENEYVVIGPQLAQLNRLDHI